jgi:hypothetical protein
MTLIAYLCLQHLRLQAAIGGKKKRQRAATSTQLTSHPAPAAGPSGARHAPAMSVLPNPLHPWFDDESAKVVLVPMIAGREGGPSFDMQRYEG